MGLGEASENAGVVPGFRRRIEPLEVSVERGTLVEQFDPVAAAGADHQRLTHTAPAMAHSDAERRVRADGCPNHRVGQDIGAEELAGRDHSQVVAGAAADQRHRRACDTVSATDDLLLIAGQAVGQQEQYAMRSVFDAAEGFGRPGTRAAEVG